MEKIPAPTMPPTPMETAAVIPISPVPGAAADEFGELAVLSFILGTPPPEIGLEGNVQGT
jgi:hypothetical protein